MFAKAKVNGKEAHEVWRFLRSKTPQLVEHIHNKNTAVANFNIKDVPSNFCKFLLD